MVYHFLFKYRETEVFLLLNRQIDRVILCIEMIEKGIQLSVPFQIMEVSKQDGFLHDGYLFNIHHEENPTFEKLVVPEKTFLFPASNLFSKHLIRLQNINIQT